ncbi:hypothetical protein RJ640_002420 [Escallonia rubra]|uniref:Vinorine synthase-like n=1 Tax=Escallonia rubra TaxID=112253 RepID=A0AA88RYL7_9ASTE|nr:hypothetical protein RJ640_002420 [Escallonia rubra]
MEVEVVSREIIRPSSPKPSQLGTIKLSLLDQLSPPIYVPIIFFYPMKDGNLLKIKQLLTQLKHSLSKTLSQFFPLSGRIIDNFSVKCNDAGVLFSEAQISCNFFEFLKKPKIDLLDKFLPCPQYCTVPAVDTAIQIAIQVNIFAAGSGIAIGVCFFHKTIDGATMASFLKCWSAIASGCYDKAICPDYTTASQLFPPREALESLFKGRFTTKGKGVRRRFVFDANAIAALKGIVTSRDLLRKPSSVTVVSGFIWKCVMAAASKVALGSKQTSILAFAVDMRPRMVPPLKLNCTGNMVWQAIASFNRAHPPSSKETELSDLVSLLREAVAKIDGEYTKNLQGDEGLRAMSIYREEVEGMFSKDHDAITSYMFSSWCNFGFNEVDFGWGKPIWVSNIGGNGSSAFVNLVILMENECRGIEAWILLDENGMAILESDPEFLRFASSNPSVNVHAMDSFDS